MIEYPKIIELFGLPRTGKTTTARALLKYYSDLGIRTHLIKERACVCPVTNKISPLFNLWTASAYLKEYVEATENGYEIVISDRGIKDALVWVNSFCREQKNSAEKDFILAMNKSDLVASNTMLSLYFYADISVVLDREFGALASARKGSVLNSDVLSEYTKSYSGCKGLFPGSIHEVDTTRKSQKQTIDNVIQLIEPHSLNDDRT